MSAKLTFSPEDLIAARNTDFFQRKKNITDTVYDYYGSLINVFKKEIIQLSFDLPGEVSRRAAKISRGENYEGLPYIMLDFPAFFSPENIFAVRNLFWWGNGFSLHFIITNHFYKKYREKIRAAKNLLAGYKFSICISATPWDHHFRKGNYVPIDSLTEKSFSSIIREKEFIKIGADYSFNTRRLLSRQKKDFTALMQIVLM